MPNRPLKIIKINIEMVGRKEGRKKNRQNIKECVAVRESRAKL